MKRSTFANPVLLAAICIVLSLPDARVNAAMPNPGFWDTTQEELDALVEKSRPYLRSVEEMNNGAKLCNSLPGYTEETAHRLTNVTVLLMDEALICRDFPSTCDLSTKEKEHWIVVKAGWFSAKHIAFGVIEDIPHDPTQALTARRACAGGRALLLPTTVGTSAQRAALKTGTNAGTADDIAFIDVKGVGTRTPVLHDTTKELVSHGNGLFHLFEALYEYMNEKTASAIMMDHSRRHPKSEEQAFHSVGTYAVLSLGFQIPVKTKAGMKHFVAAGFARQASRRHPNPHGWMDYQEAAIIEQILNTYGMRSDGPERDKAFAGLPNPTCRRSNMQGTIMPRTVTDFGTFGGDTWLEEWPPKDDCLVHWGQTGRFIETSLWNDEGIGSSRTRDFLKDEYRHLHGTMAKGEPLLDYQHVRSTNNVRMRRMWEMERCWWHGECSVEEVREAVRVGLVDDILNDEASSQNEPTCHQSNLDN